MQNDPSGDNYQHPLPLFPFGSDATILKSEVVELSLPRTGDREAADELIVNRSVMSRYDVDAYGRPRILSRWEIILHALAWPVVVVALIGYVLAISLFVIHNFSTLKMLETDAKPPVKSQEVSS